MAETIATIFILRQIPRMKGTLVTHADWKQAIEEDGIAIIPDVVPDSKVSELIETLCNGTHNDHSTGQHERQTYAMRGLLGKFPACRDLADSSGIRTLVEAVLGPKAFPVRGLLFDKIPEANWKVAWHQDLTIQYATKRKFRVSVPGQRRAVRFMCNHRLVFWSEC